MLKYSKPLIRDRLGVLARTLVGVVCDWYDLHVGCFQSSQSLLLSDSQRINSLKQKSKKVIWKIGKKYLQQLYYKWSIFSALF